MIYLSVIISDLMSPAASFTFRLNSRHSLGFNFPTIFPEQGEQILLTTYYDVGSFI